MLFTRWEVRVGKHCARCLEYGPMQVVYIKHLYPRWICRAVANEAPRRSIKIERQRKPEKALISGCLEPCIL